MVLKFKVECKQQSQRHRPLQGRCHVTEDEKFLMGISQDTQQSKMEPVSWPIL